MASEPKAAANRANARRSTGPRTEGGKTLAKMNATSHGLRALTPVLPGERPKDWEDHRAGVVDALAPVGTLEADLAGRVALLTWRLRRVVAYETAVTAAGVETAAARARGEEDEDDPFPFPSRYDPRTSATVRRELATARGCAESAEHTRDQFRRLAGLPDDHRLDGAEAFDLLREATGYTPNADVEAADVGDEEFLAAIGVPADWHDEADLWDGWTAGLVRAGVAAIAEDAGMTPRALLDHIIREADRAAGADRRRAGRLEAELAALAAGTRDAERAARSRAVLPGAEEADKVMRYEAHLARQLTQTLHLLERLQAARAGNPPPPPAAVDVTVEAGGVSVAPAG